MSMMATITCDISGSKPKLFLKSHDGCVKSDTVMKYLKDIKKHIRGKKLLLIWDGLPAHRAKIVRNFIAGESTWLKVERLPSYAPELNPTEYLWSAMKSADICNLRPDMEAIRYAVKKGYDRIRRQKSILCGFLKASGLFKYDKDKYST